MNKKHHRIAADVKADILRRVKEEGVSVAQAAKDHGISEGTIYGWMVKGATCQGLISLDTDSERVLRD